MLRVWRVPYVVLTISLLAVSYPIGASAQSAADIDVLNKQVIQLYDQGKYAEAIPLAERALAARERMLGKEHLDTIKSVKNLAALYYAQGRYAQAEPLFRRALAGQERVLGKKHPDTLSSVSNLAALYLAQGSYAKAEALYRRALAGFELLMGKEHPATLRSVDDLAALFVAQGRYTEAEVLYKRTLAARERQLGREHPQMISSVNRLAALYQLQGRYVEAEPLLRRALESAKRVLGREHPVTLTIINDLAVLYDEEGRYRDAEALYKKALSTLERTLGKEHPSTLATVNNLGGLYQVQNRYDEAEPLLRRALASRERVLGKDHPDTLRSVANLAALYTSERRYEDAEPLVKRDLESAERLLGADHPHTLLATNNLAELYYSKGHYREAGPLYKAVLNSRERILGKDHPDFSTSLGNLAALYFAERKWLRADELWHRSTDLIIRRMERDMLVIGRPLSGKRKKEATQSISQFQGYIKVSRFLDDRSVGQNQKRLAEMFKAAQWARDSEAAEALVQMAFRSAMQSGKELAALLRERLNLDAEWQKLDRTRNLALSFKQSNRYSKDDKQSLNRINIIEKRVAEIDRKVLTEFPDADIILSSAYSQPLSINEVQALLRKDEALVLFFDTPELKPSPEETFIWVVTKTDVRWVRSELGTEALTREVQALRCGLDSVAAKETRCTQLTGETYTDKDEEDDKPLAFHPVRAHKLYKTLFGQVENLIKGKHLLIVPSGPLTQLPFQVLVTAPPSDETSNKTAAWLVREHAVTILPAVSSLKALRRISRPSLATKPMIGFGNPLLDGPQNDPQYGAYYKKLAKQARDNQQCRTTFQRVAAFFGLRGVTPVETRGGLAQTSHIRMQVPLPETAEELCAVARDLKADTSELRLGARATEHEVKALSASGKLAQYRVVHFATHGALAGELKGSNEPGLILTPPATASQNDDGYLSASEIAALKLDANWVILSACNTAAGDAKGAQALSGLARAFIYAQARALLVSHWAVNSDATVKLITGAMREMASDPKVGHAEALRRSMLALIDKGDAQETHPANWAPFVVVGEGGR